MKDEYEVSKLQQDLSKMMDVAYDEHCNRQIAIEALEQIVQVPYDIATDARAVKEMVRIALEALEMVKQPEKDKTFAQG